MTLQQEKFFRTNRPRTEGGDSPVESQSRGSFSSNRIMRIGKVGFPNFGGEDLQGWVYRCDHFFAMDDTPESEKLRFVVVHLEGDALQWHQSYMRTCRLFMMDLSWPSYVRLLLLGFLMLYWRMHGGINNSDADRFLERILKK